jgi:hypothetical protein
MPKPGTDGASALIDNDLVDRECVSFCSLGRAPTFSDNLVQVARVN